MRDSTEEELGHIRGEITRILRLQGYEINDGAIGLPAHVTKADLRHVNEIAVSYRKELAEPTLRRHEDELLSYIANGSEVVPHLVKPKLVMVQADTKEALLFRYACLHWSIPVSEGYGRRLRFLVIDESNGKLMGVFGLGDPVYALKARDDYIGWNPDSKAQNMYHVMDAYVLGAVPPYSALICGKLVALLTLSNEVRQAFAQRYGGRRSIIAGKTRQPWLILLTTTSALGRSSVYNRIRLNGYDYWRSVGFTQGSGEFHFANGVYRQMRAFVEQNCAPTAKHPSWGHGFRSRREVVKKCLNGLGLSSRLLYHGIRREVYVAELAESAASILRGQISAPSFHDWPASHLSECFLARWLLPRAERMPEYRDYCRDSYRLWPI